MNSLTPGMIISFSLSYASTVSFYLTGFFRLAFLMKHLQENKEEF